ncbi:MAG: hypothetical protein QG625_1385 [Cyanobacteriota bacterium erpe_2018_sw_39hr_WHONDRS-SW48-000098_B_bin.30]|jgi:hypothetical protein|nr:hypothetical protein [Cyanobacteriota bacterium erpe_2018_sw_39hr_WHONDRS-SW48-000098_B_bin.30]
MKQAVICIVPTEVEADRIVDQLRASGFPDSSVSILMPDRMANKDLGHEKHSKAPEGAAAGAGTGMVLGGALGWLAGIGSLAIPGIGPFVAAGPIMAMLGGAALGGAAGGATGGLIGLGLPEYEAKQYEGRLRDGNILLSVHTENMEEAKQAEQIFKNGGAKDIHRTGEEKVKGR